MALHYLQVDNLTKSFGDNLLFKRISFGLFENQRTALIAKNGAGKSTLLKIIAGKEGYDEGSVTFRTGLKVGILEQDPSFEKGCSIGDICNKSEDPLQMKQVLGKLKIHDLDAVTDNLSGGQIKRIALAQVLASKPNLLILDEPTNHLDLEMVEWLENYLRKSKLALLMITHDLTAFATKYSNWTNNSSFLTKGITPTTWKKDKSESIIKMRNWLALIISTVKSWIG